ncbi:MAG: sodium:solute symporter, partial [Candidatus Nanoarchaeia archaeon]
MALSWFDIVLVVLYLIIVIAIGLWVRRRETTKEFLLAGRKVNTLQTVASMVAVLGGMVIVSQAALAFDLGFSAIWLYVGFALGTIGLGLFAGRIKKISDKYEFLTISDYIFTRFDRKSGFLAAIIVFVAFFSLLTAQFIAGGSLFSPLLGIDYYLAVIIMGVGTLFYLLLGGFKAVIKTDLLQFFIMLIVFLILLFTISPGEYSSEQLDFGILGIPTILIFVVMGIFTLFGSADIWQRLFASQSSKTARNATFITALLFLVFGIALTFVGVAAKNNFPDISSNEAFYYGFFQLVPEWLLGISIIVVLAAIMSSIDTQLFVLSSSIAKDFFYRNKKISNEEMARIIRVSLVVLAVLSMVVAIFVADILTILFGIISLLLAVSPSIVASLFWRIKRNSVFLSMFAGIISLLYLV